MTDKSAQNNLNISQGSQFTYFSLFLLRIFLGGLAKFGRNGKCLFSGRSSAVFSVRTKGGLVVALENGPGWLYASLLHVGSHCRKAVTHPHTFCPSVTWPRPLWFSVPRAFMLPRIGFLGIFIEHGSTSPGSNRVHTSLFTGVMAATVAAVLLCFNSEIFMWLTLRDFCMADTQRFLCGWHSDFCAADSQRFLAGWHLEIFVWLTLRDFCEVNTQIFVRLTLRDFCVAGTKRFLCGWHS